MKTLIIGFGVSGKAVAGFLERQGIPFVVVDKKGALPDSPDFPLDDIDRVVVSPGISSFHPIVQRAKNQGLKVTSEIELAFEYLSNRSFGVTGSNGKTTTVTLMAHILNSAGKKAKTLGNVGCSVLSYLEKPDPSEILIIELSSFQLEHLHLKKLEMGFVLNITPNHLDRHPSMEDYAAAKANIQLCASVTFVSVQVLEDFAPLFAQAQSFEKNVALINELEYTQWMMASKQSVQAAYLLCKRCGVTDVDFLQGLKTYKKPAHRIEWVAKINEITYYNDSKSSNIHSTMHAVGRIEGDIVLIVGGVHKGSSYKPWIGAFQGKVRHIIAYGKAAPIMKEELSAHFPLTQVERFDEAVKLAKEIARPVESVLLSPGCSSYDQFENYEERGDVFKRLLREE